MVHNPRISQLIDVPLVLALFMFIFETDDEGPNPHIPEQPNVLSIVHLDARVLLIRSTNLRELFGKAVTTASSRRSGGT